MVSSSRLVVYGLLFAAVVLPFVESFLFPMLGGGGGGGAKTFTDESSILCNNPAFKEAIDKSLTDDLPKTLAKLHENLKASNETTDFVALCGDKPLRWVSHLETYCIHGNEKFTCHVFQA
ncbi:hypothetical protein QR680_018254 [Steinernema hermaphroditum]|uniref:Ground-like domain-containing protein n=1 Tax=Steinernema hermaphroditum TaxID=289476 RepID=A0AA39LQF9_9BILA|nr:hypothetical protein QR680_018254 [Steinernema hermaphroditum]